MEIRKTIPGYERYLVSNMGGVKSLSIYNSGKEGILKTKYRKGYLICYLTRNGKRTTATVSRLVAMAFLENPNNKRTVNHKDGNKQNNCVDNLERATDSENCKHRFTNLGHKATYYGKFGYEHNCSKEVGQYNKEGIELMRYGSISEAARKTGICGTNISISCKKENRTAGGYFRKFIRL